MHILGNGEEISACMHLEEIPTVIENKKPSQSTNFGHDSCIVIGLNSKSTSVCTCPFMLVYFPLDIILQFFERKELDFWRYFNR